MFDHGMRVIQEVYCRNTLKTSAAEAVDRKMIATNIIETERARMSKMVGSCQHQSMRSCQ